MSALSETLIRCLVQVSIFASGALILQAIFARRRPAAGALSAGLALVGVGALSALAFVPWPHWLPEREATRPDPVGQPAPDERGTSPSIAVKSETTSASPSPVAPHRIDATHPLQSVRPVPSSTVASTSKVDDDRRASDLLGAVLSHAMVAGSRGQSQPASPTPAPIPSSGGSLARLRAAVAGWCATAERLRIPAVLVAAYFIGLMAAVVRLVAGAFAVRSYCRRSTPIADAGLHELCDILSAELECGRDVELRETAGLSTAATVGWLRPVILFPADWRQWTANERRAVLAHEIAHVRRGDFRSWMAAQVGLTLHFYHPLVRWLAHRLRLQQELAADAIAARTLGTSRAYLATLAALALRQSQTIPAWPVRAFLPTPKTFFRRIEMLRREKLLRVDVSRTARLGILGTLLAAAALCGGLRAPQASDDPVASRRPPSVPATATTTDVDDTVPSVSTSPESSGVVPTRTSRTSPSEALRSSIDPLPLPLSPTDEPRPPEAPAAPVYPLPPSHSPFGAPARPVASRHIENRQLRAMVDLEYVPRDAILVAAIRPRQLTARPRVKDAPALRSACDAMERVFGLSCAKIEQVTAVALLTTQTPEKPHVVQPVIGGWIIRTASPADRALVVTEGRVGHPEAVEYAGRKYTRGARFSYLLSGDRVVVLASDESILRRMIVAGERGPGNAAWAARMMGQVDVIESARASTPSEMLALTEWDALVVGQRAESKMGSFYLNLPGMGWGLVDLPISPPFQTLIATARVDERVNILGSALLESSAASAAASQDAPELWKCFAKQIRGDFALQRDMLSVNAGAKGAAQLRAIDTVDAFIDSVRVKQAGLNVALTAELEVVELGEFASALLADPQTTLAANPARKRAVQDGPRQDAQRETAIRGAKMLAHRETAIRKAKMLALAMHNFHDRHGTFPPAVVLGPDGKTPHSWRVELLPYLDASKLYDQYKQDEPWDSAANKKILEQMPDVFRSASDDPKSTNSSYFVFTGSNTMFPGTKRLRLRDITDGTSNTLMLVESKRATPWTKPEDIPFDPDKPVPEIGGFIPGAFVASLADGSVRVWRVDQVRDQLKWLIQHDDGHRVSPP